MNWRATTLLLIAANLIYWAWTTWIYEPQNNLTDHRFNAETPELVIVAESDSNSQDLASRELLTENNEFIEPLAEAAVLNTATSLGSSEEAPSSIDGQTRGSAGIVEEASISVCHRVGYFVDKAETDKAQAWLNTENLDAVVKTTTENIFAGYWVHLPSYPNAAAAAQVVDALREKNIKDLFVETRLPNRNAISLGLFRQRNGAEQRLKQIQALGFPARIINRELEQTVRWLEFEMDSRKVPPLARIPVTQGQVRRLERQDCLLVNAAE